MWKFSCYGRNRLSKPSQGNHIRAPRGVLLLPGCPRRGWWIPEPTVPELGAAQQDGVGRALGPPCFHFSGGRGGSFIRCPPLQRGAVMTSWPCPTWRAHTAGSPQHGKCYFVLSSGWGLMKKADEFLTVSRKISFPGDFFFSPPKVN